MNSVPKWLIAMGFLLIAGIFVQAQKKDESAVPPYAIDSPEIARQWAVAAQRFLDSLQEGLQAKYLFQDAERGNFHFFPIVRRGVPLKILNDAQRQLGLALLNAGLSHEGFQKSMTIMSLGEILRESDESPNQFRDSDQYYFTIFGDPDPKGTWGFRVEGFHLSFNFTVIKGRWISVTPSFLGAIPATVAEGPREGLQVLRDETEMGRALATSLDAEQRKVGFGELPDFLTETVGGFTTGNVRKLERREPKGLPASEMTPEQRKMLMLLIREYVERHRRELAEQDLARIEKAGIDEIHFIWAGGLEPGQPHHYLIQGPTFLIEYDNTQDDANHVHCIYRDFDNDFGDSLLEHYRKHHHPESGH